MSEITGSLSTGGAQITGTPRTAATDVASAAVDEAGHLIIVMSDGRTIDAGSTIGPRGIGISSMQINTDGDLIITYDDGLIVNAGHIMGAVEAAEAAAEAAQGQAEAAAASATEAGASATEAGMARTGAETARDAAQASETAAGASATAAGTAKTATEAARDVAQGAATAAGTSATNAAGSASAAATARTGAEAAQTGAQNAKTSAESAQAGAEAARTLADGFAANAYQSYQAALALVGNLSPQTWEEVQNLIRAGWGATIFPVGTQLEVTHADYGTIIWDVVAHDQHLDPTGANAHSMTILMRDVIYGTVHDNTEALYYCEAALPAGTYNFTLLAGYDIAYGGGLTYEFTLAQPIPAGGVIMFPWTSSTQASATKISTYASRVATTATESNVSVTLSGGTPSGTNLGTANGTGNMNHAHRIRYGSNNWKESSIRQLINSGAAAGMWWTPQTRFDRPPSYLSTRAGFLRGLPAEFVAVLGAVDLTTARNTVYEASGSTGGSDVTRDKMFAPSMTELGLGTNNSIAEGAVMEYYNGASQADRIKRDITAQTTARNWWLRSPYPSNAYGVRIVDSSGALISYYAYNGYGLAAACTIY